MSYIVIIRKEGTTRPATIHRGEDLPNLLAGLRKRCLGKRQRKWFAGDRVDAFIRAHYKVDMSASDIAAKLCVGRRRVTKNMVISRAKTLGLIRPPVGSPACSAASERPAQARSASS